MKVYSPAIGEEVEVEVKYGLDALCRLIYLALWECEEISHLSDEEFANITISFTVESEEQGVYDGSRDAHGFHIGEGWMSDGFSVLVPTNIINHKIPRKMDGWERYRFFSNLTVLLGHELCSSCGGMDSTCDGTGINCEPF